MIIIDRPDCNKQESKKKCVKFSEIPKIVSTFSAEDYDRIPTEIAVLKYKDMLELMTIKLELRQSYEKEIALKNSTTA